MASSNDRIVSATRNIAASPEVIFDLLADPSRHPEIDGSGTVNGSSGDPQRLELGSKFGMGMKIGPIPYRTYNTVVEFEENRLIAWAHFGKHRWRYELEPRDDGTTDVTESFDYSYSVLPKAIELMGFPAKHADSIPATLERLAHVVEA